MDAAQLPDLDSLDREALLALLFAHQEELRSLAASHEDQLRSLQAELESHRQTLSQQDEQLRSRSEQIEHLKLMIEKRPASSGAIRVELPGGTTISVESGVDPATLRAVLESLRK